MSRLQQISVCCYCPLAVHVINKIIVSDNENTILYSGSAAQSIWRDMQASSWPFQSIPRHVPFFFLSPTRHCTKWCFVSRQQTVSPPLVAVSALPSCPMASAPIRIYCCCLLPFVLVRVCDPAHTLTHPDGLKWLEREQEKKRKKPHIPRREGMNMERS